MQFKLFVKTKGHTIFGYSHILSELISGIILSVFLETIYVNNQAIYNLSQGCKLSFSKPSRVSKTGRFVRALYTIGGDRTAPT